MTKSNQVDYPLLFDNMKVAFDWLNNCPFKYHISSMQTGQLRIKLQVPYDNEPLDLLEESEETNDE